MNQIVQTLRWEASGLAEQRNLKKFCRGIRNFSNFLAERRHFPPQQDEDFLENDKRNTDFYDILWICGILHLLSFNSAAGLQTSIVSQQNKNEHLLIKFIKETVIPVAINYVNSVAVAAQCYNCGLSS